MRVIDPAYKNQPPNSARSIDNMEPLRRRTRQLSFLHKIHPRVRRMSDSGYSSVPSPICSSTESFSSFPFPKLTAGSGRIPDAAIYADFSSLYTSISDHVDNYYSSESVVVSASQLDIETAGAGLSMPWTRIRLLLHDPESRRLILILCIAWNTLSRCSLLSVGTSSLPGNCFLPPEIVERFEAFASRLGLNKTDLNESSQCKSNAKHFRKGRGQHHAKSRFRSEANLVMLAHWKQISAIRLQAKYAPNGISYLDSCTTAIERAISDLNPLLQVYSMTASEVDGSRLRDLREILRNGAKFAIMLFEQRDFWQFDWSQGISISSRHHEYVHECE